jgi:tRNA 5-methylaminomethyl-2-thiouridine biosynthesis bifunctional protein
VFCVGELGFGTGLNFILTMREFCGDWLWYLAYELNPLTRADLHRFLVAQLGESKEIDLLCARYPHAIEGLHLIHFKEYRSSLQLFLGDALSKLRETTARVDAWYLDGFSPERNPALWSAEVLREVTRLSRPGATLGTYSVSASVRERLSALGWELAKVKGVGRKREVLTGRLPGADGDRGVPQRVAVVGGGIAGASVAQSLSRRGISVTLFERNKTLFSEASGNRRGIVFPYLSAERDRRHRFYLAAFQFLNRSFVGDAEGALYLPFRERQEKFLVRVAEFHFPPEFLQIASPAEAQELAGVVLPGNGGLFFPEGRSYSFKEHFSLEQADVQVRAEAEFSGDFDAIVLCTGGGGLSSLPAELRQLFTPVMGEVAAFEATPASRGLKRILCGDGYITPDTGSGHLCGATYHRGVSQSVVSPQAESSLSEIAGRLLPVGALVPGSIRAGVRATTPDRLPVIGHFRDNIYLSLGHGSRGGVSAPLVAEQVAAEICGEPYPIERTVLDGLRVGRFGL